MSFNSPDTERKPWPTLRVDESIDNADWTKQSWDLPYDNVEDLHAYLDAQGITVEHFKTRPVYRFNLKTQPWLLNL